MLQDCINSFKDQVKEVIVVDELWDNLSKKINYGVSKATTKWVIICNDDATLISGKAQGLCRDNVVSPSIEGGTPKLFHAHCWGIPRDLYWQLGGMSEDYNGVYYDDSDMWMRIVTYGSSISINPDVIISHPHPATTIKTIPDQAREQDNRSIFLEKWGVEGLRITGCR